MARWVEAPDPFSAPAPPLPSRGCPDHRPQQPGPGGDTAQLGVNNGGFCLSHSFLLALWPLPIESGPWLPRGEADKLRTKKSIDFLGEFFKTHSRGNILKAQRVSFARAELLRKKGFLSENTDFIGISQRVGEAVGGLFPA